MADTTASSFLNGKQVSPGTRGMLRGLGLGGYLTDAFGQRQTPPAANPGMVAPETVPERPAAWAPAAAPERSYQVGRRPLKGPGGELAYRLPERFPALEPLFQIFPRPEHQQFIDNAGGNFGFGENGVFSESQKALPRYSINTANYGDIRYDAAFVDAARKRKADEWLNADDLFGAILMMDFEGLEAERYGAYSVLGNNCQRYVQDILRVARELAAEQDRPLALP